GARTRVAKGAPMAPVRATSNRRSRTASGRARPRRRRPPARGVRWDRLGRITLLVVLAGVLMLYVGPAASYVRTWQEAKVRRGEVRTLQREQARLLARRRALREP